AGLEQGLLADGQSFSTVQLARGLKAQCGAAHLDELFPPPSCVLFAEAKARTPAEAIFRRALQALKARDIAPDEALHVGSSLERDIAPAKKHGMRTALFAGDRNSLRADPHLVKEPAYRPDVLLTELPQIAEVVG